MYKPVYRRLRCKSEFDTNFFFISRSIQSRRVINTDKFFNLLYLPVLQSMSETVRRVQYSAKQKRSIIIYAEIHGNRKAARDHGVPESNVRLWRIHRDAIFRCEPRRMNFRGRKPLYPNLEVKLVTFILHTRAQALPVTRRILSLKAKEIAEEEGIQHFKSSEGWVDKFMKRSGFALRRRTSVCQKLPSHFEEKLIEFQRYIIHLRSTYNHALGQIGNADETPVYFDMPRNNTVNEVGAREVKVLTSGYEKMRITVMLCITADGEKLPPYLILNRKTIPKNEKFPLDIVVRCNPKGWMTSDLMVDWINSVWNRRPGATRHLRSMLVLDAFKGHLRDDVKDELKKRSCDLVVIPGGMTSQLQPLDVSVNKPFKNLVRHEYENWLLSGNLPLTTTGKIKKAPVSTVAHWVSNAWKKIDAPLIIKSFKKCSISNALDGTEDDAFWEDREEEADEEADSTDDDCDELDESDDE